MPDELTFQAFKQLYQERDTARDLAVRLEQELAEFKKISRELLWMLDEHKRIAELVHQPPWFMAPMSRPIEALRALTQPAETPAAPPPAAAPQAPDADSLPSLLTMSDQEAAELLRYLRATQGLRKHDAKHVEREP